MSPRPSEPPLPSPAALLERLREMHGVVRRAVLADRPREAHGAAARPVADDGATDFTLAPDRVAEDRCAACCGCWGA